MGSDMMSSSPSLVCVHTAMTVADMAAFLPHVETLLEATNG